MLLWLAGLACESRLGFDAVSFYPTHGWTDGCADVEIGGHGFADEIEVKVGDNLVTGVTAVPPGETEIPELDKGFKFYGVTPPGQQGFNDVTVTSAGESDVIPNAFYYVACFGAPYLEAVMTPAVDSGGTVELWGCGFDVAAHEAFLATPGWNGTDDKKKGSLSYGPFALASVCGTARVSFAASNVPDGTYELYLSDGKGLLPDPACVDKDTADTAAACEEPQLITIGGKTK